MIGSFHCTCCGKVLGHKAREKGKIACKRCKAAVDNVTQPEERHLVTKVRFLADTIAIVEKMAA